MLLMMLMRARVCSGGALDATRHDFIHEQKAELNIVDTGAQLRLLPSRVTRTTMIRNISTVCTSILNKNVLYRTSRLNGLY